MYEITKQFTFAAAHHLPQLPVTHQCSRVHGHNYRVELRLVSDELDEMGFVKDYGDLRDFKGWADALFDHRDLNDLLDVPTAEHLAKFIFDEWHTKYPQLHSVTVSETDKTTATYAARASR